MALQHNGRTIVLAAALLVGPIAAMPAASAVTTPAHTRPQTVFTANLIDRHSNLCLSVDGASTDNGARVLQWDCGTQENQQWRLVATSGGYYQVRAGHSDKCLSVSDRSTHNGAPVIQWECGLQANQQWKLDQKDNGYFSVVARHSGKCLSVPASTTQNGAAAIQWECGSQHDQHWRLG
jgi:hypothetical protein